MRFLLLIAVTLVSLSAAALSAAEPDRGPSVGQPTRLEVFPPKVALTGPRSRAQLAVTG